MKMYMIAGIYKNNDRVGCRILDSDTEKTIDVLDNQIITVLKSGTKITNLQLKNNRLSGSNGDIKRYAKIVNGSLQGNSPVVILNQIGSQGYTVSDHQGKILKLSNIDIINYASKNGIANGKLSSRDGAQFISAISGYYDIIEIPATKQPETKQPEAKQPETKQPEATVTRQQEVKQSETKHSTSGNISLSQDQMYALKRYYSLYKIDDIQANAEIQELNDAVAKDRMKLQCDKTRLLYEILARLDGIYKIARILGNDLASIVVTFMAVDLAFPKSLVFVIKDAMRDNSQALVTELFSEFSDTTQNMFKKSEYSFDIASQLYIDYLINHSLLGEYDTSEDTSIKQTISKYALCSQYSLAELGSLVGTLDLLGEWRSVLGAEMRGYKYSRYIDKMLRIAMKYTEDTTYTAIEKNEKDTILYILEGDKRYNRIDNSVSGVYAAAANKLWQIDDDNLKSRGCEYISTPLLVSELTSNNQDIKQRTIIDVYKQLLYSLKVGESKFIYNFGNFALEQIKKADELQREKDRQELDRIARESLKKQQDRKSSINQAGIGQKTESEPKLQNIQSGAKSQLQLDIESNADLSKYDPVELYKWLYDNTSIDKTSTSFIIAKDMVSRNLRYKDMSSRQKFRIDDAIVTMLKSLGYSLKNKNKQTSQANQQPGDENTENNTYMLSDRPDIKDKVDRLVYKSNTVEMQEVLKSEPYVLKICYSVLRYGKASDKQLKHINNAINILDNQ